MSDFLKNHPDPTGWAILQQALSDPSDPVPRFALADWLEEQSLPWHALSWRGRGWAVKREGEGKEVTAQVVKLDRLDGEYTFAWGDQGAVTVFAQFSSPYNERREQWELFDLQEKPWRRTYYKKRRKDSQVFHEEPDPATARVVQTFFSLLFAHRAKRAPKMKAEDVFGPDNHPK